MPSDYLPDEDHVVRYISYGKLRKDDDMNVIGVLGEAFRLRPDEEYLSATWAEYFSGSREARIVHAIQAIRESKLKVSPKSGFAIGNVGAIKQACVNRSRKIRIIHEPHDDNCAHVALRQWPDGDLRLLELLAETAWSEFVLNKDVRTL